MFEECRPGKLYLMIVNGSSQWASFGRAGQLANAYFDKVEIGKRVLEPDGTERDMTVQEYNEIVDLAERIDESK